MGQEHTQFHHNIQKGMRLKTYEFPPNGIFSLLLLDQVDQ